MRLGTITKKGWWGPMQVWGTAGRFTWQPFEQDQQYQKPPTSTITWKELQLKYLPNTVPESEFKQGWEGQGSKFASEAM